MTKSYDIEKVFNVVLAFNSENRYEDLLNIILTQMMDITNSDAGSLYILEEGKLHFRIVKNKTLNISRGVDETNDMPPIVLNKNNIENISAYAAIKNEIVIIDDVYTSSRFNFAGPKNYDKLTGYRSRSMLALPLSASWNDRVEMLGVIQLMNATDPATGESSTYADIEKPPIIPALANIAANILSNLIHIKEIRALFNSFITAMVGAIEERSEYNSSHTMKVAKLCESFAQFLSRKFEPPHKFHFDEKRQEDLVMAAMLHDIGKITTPIHIMDKADRMGAKFPLVKSRFEIKRAQLECDFLRGDITIDEHKTALETLDNALKIIEDASSAGFLKNETIEEVREIAKITYKTPNGSPTPILDSEDIEFLSIRKGTLTDAERAIMQDHASVTSRILQRINFAKYYKSVPEWAQSHHEFLDGSGYPKGLKGNELSLEVCIITIMDIFEALTAGDRPYKKAMPIEKAFSILAEMADEGKLHSELVQLFKESEVWKELLSS